MCVFFNPGAEHNEAPQEGWTASSESSAAQRPDHSPGTAPEQLNLNTNVASETYHFVAVHVFPFVCFLHFCVHVA